MTLTTVDAFTDRAFAGNPAAVCVLDAPAPEPWMRALAGEMNLSETAFVVPTADAWDLRWFTPEIEVDLCGHATLAAAHVLYETGRLAADLWARFDTRSGRLTVRRSGGRYAMDFPATPPTEQDVPGFAEAFGFEPVWLGKSRFDAFAVLENEAAVRDLVPDHAAIARLDARGVIVTARADAADRDRQRGVDVVSRFFAPGSGVPEDPVTGSAHCAIGPYWAEQLDANAVACEQVSRRGGRVDVKVLGDRVELTGSAVTVYRAELADAALPDSNA